ncbi:branched-chain amino acid ABC transporter [Chania multitudinisentens RB-25]|uniref:Branched-chain amino acid ABC transporter n=1 Tax=Chania multitudinisentens RB-25 TaxID=1441930 RepID=W0LIC7_9GAMM|nr:AzlD domain-containing protein [Chania multitudinisentens]AHG21760.1 branched-chain amino acid ABC transporter [Chania multitudinisentens RB-25]
MIWLTIVLMGVIVFFNRYCFLAPGLPVRLSQRMRTLLSFSVPAVLTAICGPIIAFNGDEWRALPENPYLWGAIFAVVLAFFLRNMLAVVLLSMLMFILLRTWF